jgi:hypothetical protein
MILTAATICLGLTTANGGDVPSVIARRKIEVSTRRGRRRGQRLREEVHPPGERCACRNPGSGRGRCHLPAACLRRHRPSAGDDDPKPGTGEQIDVVMRQHAPFFECRCSKLQTVGEDGALGLGDGDFAEPHAASPRNMSLRAGEKRVSALEKFSTDRKNIL